MSYTLLDSDEKEAIVAKMEVTLPRRKPLYKQIFCYAHIRVVTCILACIVLFALLGPLISPYTYHETNLPDKNLSPSISHIFGTDDLGRDLFTRCASGLRISLQISLIAALVDMLIGVTWGVIAGYKGGMTDQIMMRIAEMIYSMPYLLVVILITVVTGAGFFPILAAMIMLGWIQMARITRNLVQQLRHAEFVLAAHSLGVSVFGIIFRHILPNILGPVVAVMMLTIPQAIFVEAFLSFLGIGIQPPQASLGSLVSDGLGAMRLYPWRLFIPAGFISLTIFVFNLLGDSIRELLDPQTQANMS